MYLAEVGENMRLSSHFLNREEKRNHITPTQIDNAEIKPITLQLVNEKTCSALMQVGKEI